MTVLATSLEALPLWALLLLLAVALGCVAVVLAYITGALGAVVDSAFYQGGENE